MPTDCLFVSKEMQESVTLQRQLQEVEERRHGPMPEHQKVQKRSQRYTAPRTRGKYAERKCCSGRRGFGSYVMWVKQKEERILFQSDKVEKNKMADADMAAELQGLQAGEERRGSNASQTGDSCLEALWQQITAVCAAVGPNQVDAFANAVSPKVSRKV